MLQSRTDKLRSLSNQIVSTIFLLLESDFSHFFLLLESDFSHFSIIRIWFQSFFLLLESDFSLTTPKFTTRSLAPAWRDENEMNLLALYKNHARYQIWLNTNNIYQGCHLALQKIKKVIRYLSWKSNGNSILRCFGN